MINKSLGNFSATKNLYDTLLRCSGKRRAAAGVCSGAILAFGCLFNLSRWFELRDELQSFTV